MSLFEHSSLKVEKMEWCRLPGRRKRSAGSNARLGVHGENAPLDVIRICIGGIHGFGWSRMNEDRAKELVGKRIDELFNRDGEVNPSYYDIEFPLLDWSGKLQGKPVYQLVSGERTQNLTIPCYDTSLYFDDLHLENDSDAVDLIKSEALAGWDAGHRAFKLKVGRGAMHMPLQRGTERDIAIIHGVRQAVGPDARMMIDANNGYNLNLTKEVLRETKEANLTWIEEPFHEDPQFLRNLKEWMKEEGLSVMVTDGEGNAALQVVEWAKQGYLDAIQYDILHYGFHKWKHLGGELDSANVYSAPHSYGCAFGHYALGHLAPSIKKFLCIEWDEISVDGLDSAAYVISNGAVHVPDKPDLD